MKFDAVTIKNFRNFEYIAINLTNKNVLFGMNDVGKTNFLYALRFLFDKDIRRQNFTDTDYYKKNTNTPIEILVSIDIGDTEDGDSQKLRAKLNHFIGTNNSFAIEEIIKPFMKDVFGRAYKLDMSTDYSVKVKTFIEGLIKIKDEQILCSYANSKENFIFQLALEILQKSTACQLYLKAKYFKIYVDEYIGEVWLKNKGYSNCNQLFRLLEQLNIS